MFPVPLYASLGSARAGATVDDAVCRLQEADARCKNGSSLVDSKIAELSQVTFPSEEMMALVLVSPELYCLSALL